MTSAPSPLNDRTRESASLQIAPPSTSLGGAMIHRLCTDHFIRRKVSDKLCPLFASV
jgi:hypothetical protein